MTQVNGASHSNVEELLESIRSSIGDNSQRSYAGSYRGIPTTFNGQSTILGPNGETAARAKPAAATDTPASPLDDSADFELPSIFKPTAPAAHVSEAKLNLLGRLSDALSNAQSFAQNSEEQDQHMRDSGRTIIRFEPAFTRHSENPHDGMAANGASPSVEATPRPPGPALDNGSTAIDPAAPVSMSGPNNTDVKREMPSFFDTRMKRLGEKPQPQPTVQAAQPHGDAGQRAASGSTPPPVPPALPMPSAMADALGQNPLDDVAAQMLRPILRQWLSDNMPKIVEKALRSEASEAGPGDPNGRPSGPYPPDNG